MAEKERSFGNRFGNTVRIPQRTVGTVGLLGADAIKTTVGAVEDFGYIANHYTDEIVNLFSKDKKWYQKALNVPVAIGKTLVGAVEAAVKPVVNGVVNTGKTALNLTTNAWKSTFGSLFSAKPVSDISFNTIKTKKKGIIHIDTDKRTLDPNKTWTSNRGTRSKDKKRITTTATAAGAAAAGAATAAGISAATASSIASKEISYMKKDFENKIKEMEDKFNKNLQKVLKDNGELNDKISKLEESKKKLSTENADLKKTLAALQKEKETKKEEKPAETKPAETKVEAKPVETKTEEKPAEVKPAETKVEAKPVETKTEEKPAEVKPTGTKTEVKPVEPEAEGKGGEKKTEEKKKTDKK